MRVDERIASVAPSRATVLVRGGSPLDRKEIAQALHAQSPRRDEAFSELDCAQAGTSAIERVFGTAASQREPYVTRLGTLYVANVESLPLWLQPKLLLFLDRVSRPRVVVGTERDLAVAMRYGLIRHDLGERLLLVEIAVAKTKE